MFIRQRAERVLGRPADGYFDSKVKRLGENGDVSRRLVLKDFKKMAVYKQTNGRNEIRALKREKEDFHWLFLFSLPADRGDPHKLRRLRQFLGSLKISQPRPVIEDFSQSPFFFSASSNI